MGLGEDARGREPRKAMRLSFFPKGYQEEPEANSGGGALFRCGLRAKMVIVARHRGLFPVPKASHVPFFGKVHVATSPREGDGLRQDTRLVRGFCPPACRYREAAYPGPDCRRIQDANWSPRV